MICPACNLPLPSAARTVTCPACGRLYLNAETAIEPRSKPRAIVIEAPQDVFDVSTSIVFAPEQPVIVTGIEFSQPPEFDGRDLAYSNVTSLKRANIEHMILKSVSILYFRRGNFEFPFPVSQRAALTVGIDRCPAHLHCQFWTVDYQGGNHERF